MSRRRQSQKPATAEHRPAARRRRFRHDEVTAVDLFSGFGGLTRGLEQAGVTTIMAANHNTYKVSVHEANHPDAEHWVADLVDPEAGDYHSAADLPAADLLAAGVSCVNHSHANSKKAYAQALSLFDIDDPDYEARVTRSERDRATAVCVLQYAGKHHPKLILVECTTELTCWGKALPNRPKVGDGTTFRWWLGEFDKLGYQHRTLYLNSQFFGVPQSRDRLFICMWDRALPAPDLEHRPHAWCAPCGQVIESVWTWRTGIPPSGRVRWGDQYDYRCPRCMRVVVPPRAPSIEALDLSNLGTRIGERDKPLAASTMARVDRCIKRWGDFPAVLVPAKALRGTERHPWQPMSTQTSQQETALLSTGAVLQTANASESPGSECRTRELDQPLWTQPASNSTALLAPPTAVLAYRAGTMPAMADEPMPTQGALESMALLATGVLPYRQNTLPATASEPMATQVADQTPALLAVINNNGDEAKYRARPADVPLTGFTTSPTHALLSAGLFAQNGGPADTAARGLDEPTPTLTAVPTTALAVAELHDRLAGLTPDECFYRMLLPHEVQVGCGFDQAFIVWGSARDQIDGYGNAVTPAVGTWLGLRLRAALHGDHGS